MIRAVATLVAAIQAADARHHRNPVVRFIVGMPLNVVVTIHLKAAANRTESTAPAILQGQLCDQTGLEIILVNRVFNFKNPFSRAL